MAPCELPSCGHRFSCLTCLSDPNLEVDIDKLNKEFMEQSEVGLIHRSAMGVGTLVALKSGGRRYVSRLV